MALKVKDRVKLITTKWGSSSDNPTWKTYKMKGTVTSVSMRQFIGDMLPIEVRWDNHTSNTYGEQDLMKIDTEWDEENND